MNRKPEGPRSVVGCRLSVVGCRLSANAVVSLGGLGKSKCTTGSLPMSQWILDGEGPMANCRMNRVHRGSSESGLRGSEIHLSHSQSARVAGLG